MIAPTPVSLLIPRRPKGAQRLVRAARNNSHPKMILANAEGMSARNYEEQIQRRQQGFQHMWTDRPDNTAKIGDIFAFVKNSLNIKGSDEKTPGKIEMFLIEDVKGPTEQLETWGTDQGDRQVLLLNSRPLYEGTMVEFKSSARTQKDEPYKEGFNVQGTRILQNNQIKHYIEGKIL